MPYADSPLEPILKWPGGKQGELEIILSNLPPTVDRYFEPFLGGGAVYLNMSPTIPALVNDKSSDLIDLYHFVAENSAEFFSTLENIDRTWQELEQFLIEHGKLTTLYEDYRNNTVSEAELKKRVTVFVQNATPIFENMFAPHLLQRFDIFLKEATRAVVDKMVRMKKLEATKGTLPIGDVESNIEGALKAALYYYIRDLYNRYPASREQRAAFFYFLRENAYAAMFRFNKQGHFNVPYGGLSYNKKRLRVKIQKMRNPTLQRRLQNTIFANDDFLEFLQKHHPTEEDFIFFDPPYDSEFSSYDQNIFDRSDQIRLAEYIITCKANIMLVIKSTEFILSLYGNSHLKVLPFDKTYMYTIKERNNRDVTHLMITNYSVPEVIPVNLCGLTV